MQSGAIDYFCSQIHQAPLRPEIAHFVFAILNNVLLTLSGVGGGAIILLNFPTLKRGVLTHKHDPKRVCKFKLDHFVAPGAIFEDFFFRGVPPGTPRI